MIVHTMFVLSIYYSVQYMYAHGNWPNDFGHAQTRRIRALMQGGPPMLRRLAQAAGTVCGLIDSYGDRFARIWFHQAALDAIAAQPVPYMLTPSAEALLSASAPQRQLTRADLRLRA